MESIYAIGAGLGLRAMIDIVSRHNDRLGGTLIGLWEGVVLYHFVRKMPLSFDPYVGYGVRLFVDFIASHLAFEAPITPSIVRIELGENLYPGV